MKTLKIYIYNQFNTLFLVFGMTICSILLLSIRLKITHSFFYLFLAWNLFLAMIPYFISAYLILAKNLKRWKLGLALLVWLLFLPNAPYLLTDLIHLRLSSNKWLGYDALMISVFAATGLAFYVLSLKNIHKIFLENFSRKITSILIFIVPFLTGFGVYMGRVLRWNSWDILHKPHHIFLDIMQIIFNPLRNFEAWAFTLCIGLFLCLTYSFLEKQMTK